MDYSLSGLDIENVLKKFNKKCYLTLYKNLIKYNTIDELLREARYIIILYETTKNYGHWCCLFKNNKNSIEFFDSYGIRPDDELKYSTELFRKKNKMNFPLLTYLLLECPYNIEYNQYKLQKMTKDISTCGRWVLLRCLLSNFNIDNFYKIFKNVKNKDKATVIMTEDFIK
jgi:hypothetical protein